MLFGMGVVSSKEMYLVHWMGFVQSDTNGKNAVHPFVEFDDGESNNKGGGK